MCVGGFCPARPVVAMEENYYPNLFDRYLHPRAENGAYPADGPVPNVPVITCHICHDQLDVMGTAVSAQEPCEQARVLQCGHIVGKGCFREWLKSCFGRTAIEHGGHSNHENAQDGAGRVAGVKTRVECPMCKAPAACTMCGVILGQVILPTRSSSTGSFEAPDQNMRRPGKNSRACIECAVFVNTRLGAVVHLIQAHQELFPARRLDVGMLEDIASSIVPVAQQLAAQDGSSAKSVEIVKIGPWRPRPGDPPALARCAEAAIEHMNSTLYPLACAATWDGRDGWALDQGLFMFGRSFFEDATARFGAQLVLDELRAVFDALGIARDTPLDRVCLPPVIGEVRRKLHALKGVGEAVVIAPCGM